MIYNNINDTNELYSVRVLTVVTHNILYNIAVYTYSPIFKHYVV